MNVLKKPQDSSEKLQLHFGEGNILIVDDDPDICTLLALELEEKGFEVFMALNTEEARWLLESSSIDLIICDLRMPGDNGLQFFQEIKTAKNLAPGFIFITGYQDLSPPEAKAQGALELFDKPIDTNKLIATIHSYLKDPNPSRN